MHARKLRMVKPPLPPIGICEACNSQFKSSKRSPEEAEREIKAAFDAHHCKVRDDNRTAQTNMRGYMPRPPTAKSKDRRFSSNVFIATTSIA
jgi:hypothetical protein